MNALILGLGISGKGAASFLQKMGWEVTTADRNGAGDYLDTHIFDDFPFDLVILSPGIPLTHPLCECARKHHVEVICDVELAARHIKQRCIGVTGTNGKTTVTSMIAHVLGAKAVGNIGNSICEYLLDPNENDILVFELSSYQLETMKTPFLDAALIINLSPDHLDRYPSYEAYCQAKCRITHCVKEEGKLYLTKEVHTCFRKEINCDKKIEFFSESSYENVIAAYMVCRDFGVSDSDFYHALAKYKKEPHRMEYLGVQNGISFYNDSKGTNLESVIYAVRQVTQPIHLIAGGEDKGLSYQKWIEAFKNRVVKIYAIGETAQLLKAELGGRFPVTLAQTLEQAFVTASQEAKEGEAILLSPGCASFDQFQNYQHRGEEFKRLVLALGGAL